MSAMIEVAGLTKRYRQTDALRGMTFRVPEGSIFGFIGQNGAGKTTTMKILATLLPPGEGAARVGGWDVTRHPREVRRIMGYMPDFFGVYDDLRVGEYLDFYAGAQGLRGPAARRLRDDLLELVDLAPKREAYVNDLSRGMQQRLCLARALVHDPAVLLLDEPASGLDPQARVEMRTLLRELQIMGKTILISSHILAELADFCTHIGIVAGGRLLSQGTLEEVLRETRERSLRLQVLAPEDDEGAAAREGDRAAVILAAIPGVSRVRVGGTQVDFAFDGDPAATAALLEALIRSGVGVLSFTETAGSLEDTFLRLTKGVVS